MKQDEFEQLLQRADRAASVPLATPKELADKARQSVHRQRRARTACASCACLAALLIVVISAMPRWNSSGSGGPTPESQIIAAGDRTATSLEDSPSPEELRRRISELSAEADRLTELSRAMRRVSLLKQETASSMTQLASSNQRRRVQIPVRFIIEQEAEITARVMVEQANRWQENPQLREKAKRYYHRTIRLFPMTAAARIAKDRLAQFQEHKGVTT